MLLLSLSAVSAPKSSNISLVLKSLHWLKIKHRIDYKILSLTYKVLTTTQPSYLYNLVSVEAHCSARFSNPCSSTLLFFFKFSNCSFRHASPCLWSYLLKELHQPADHEDLSLSSERSDLIHNSSSFDSSPLSPSITPSHFHSRLKTHLIHKSFPLYPSTFPPTGLIPPTSAVFCCYSRACRF